jgi:hypothetical protein
MANWVPNKPNDSWYKRVNHVAIPKKAESRSWLDADYTMSTGSGDVPNFSGSEHFDTLLAIHTYTIDLPANREFAVIVSSVNAASRTISSATLDGVALVSRMAGTFAFGRQDFLLDSNGVQVPGGLSKTLTVVFGNTVSRSSASVFDITGRDFIVGGEGSGGPSTTGVSAIVATEAGDALVGAGTQSGGATAGVLGNNLGISDVTVFVDTTHSFYSVGEAGAAATSVPRGVNFTTPPTVGASVIVGVYRAPVVIPPVPPGSDHVWTLSKGTDPETDLRIEITAAPTTGDAPTSYEYSMRATGGSWGGLTTFPGGATPTPVNVLAPAPGASNDVQVRAVNAAGPGPATIKTIDLVVVDEPIVVETPPTLDPGKMLVGLQIGGAFVSGVYSHPVDTVAEGSPVFYIDAVQVPSTHVMVAGNTSARAEVALTSLSNPVPQYAATAVVTIIDYTHVNPIANNSFDFEIPAGTGDAAAPVLSSPTAAATSATTANLSVTTDEGNGTLYVVGTASATAPTAAQVKLGQDHTGAAADAAGSTAVAAAGVLTGSAGGLTPSSTRYIHFMQEDAGGNQSAVVSSTAINLHALPVLSSPLDDAGSPGTSTGSVSTTIGAGTLYWVVTTSATTPSGAQIKAGQDHLGAVATSDGAQSVAVTGVQTLSPPPSGLGSATTYYTHFYHEDTGLNGGTPISANGFTTAAGGVAIEFVGATRNGGSGGTARTLDLTTLTGGTAAAPAAGDFVLLMEYCGGVAQANLGVDSAVSPGWTDLPIQYNGPATRDVTYRISYKRMGTTPDTTVTTLAYGESGHGQGLACRVYRNVSAATPLHVNPIYFMPTGQSDINPPAITPTVDGALIVIGGAGSQSASGNISIAGAPVGFINFNGGRADGATTDLGFGTADAVWNTGGGTVDPGVFTPSIANNAQNCSIAFSLALTPA